MTDDSNEMENPNVTVIRLTPARLGLSLLYILWAVYVGMTGNWLAVGFVVPVLVYQWMYYVTLDDNWRMANMGVRVVKALYDLDADYKKFREHIKQKLGDDYGSDA